MNIDNLERSFLPNLDRDIDLQTLRVKALDLRDALQEATNKKLTFQTDLLKSELKKTQKELALFENKIAFAS